MKKVIQYLFPEYTSWAIMDVFIESGAYRCVQVRMNINTGLKVFTTSVILRNIPSVQKELSIPESYSIKNINKLTNGGTANLITSMAGTEKIS